MTNQQRLDWIQNTYNQDVHGGKSTTGTADAIGTIAHHNNTFSRFNVGSGLGVDYMGEFGDFAGATDAIAQSMGNLVANHPRLQEHEETMAIYGAQSALSHVDPSSHKSSL